MQAVSVGPWVLSLGVLAILLAFAAANAAASFMKKRGHGDAGTPLTWLLLAALAAARIAFVVRWWPAYRDGSWWSVLDIRDGGFVAWVGIGVVLAGGLAWALRRPKLRDALMVTVLTGLGSWLIMTMVVSQLQRSAHPPLPDVALHDLDGDTTTLAALAGKPMVVNLWATWCPPCRREMPMLVAASHKFDHVRFVFVDQGESADAVRQWMAAEHLAPSHVLIDTGSDLARHYHAPGYPTTLFVDASGHLRDMRIGPLSEASLRSHLDRVVSPSAK